MTAGPGQVEPDVEPDEIDPDDPERPAIEPDDEPDELDAPPQRPGPDPPARQPWAPAIRPSRTRQLAAWLLKLSNWAPCRHKGGLLFDRVGTRAVLRCPSCLRYRELNL